MDSLLASYASSDEEDERSSPPRGREQVEAPKTGGFLTSLPPPKSSSSLFSSLPPPKAPSPFSSTSSSSSSVPKNPRKMNEEEQQLQGNREESVMPPSLPRPSSSLFSSLPQPKSSSSSSSSLFSSLPSPKTHSTEQQILPQSSLASPASSSKRVVQFRPPTMNPPPSFGNDDEEDEDEDEDEKEKQRKKSESLIQTSSVKSFLSSIPKPKNSTTLGALPSASGTGRRSMLEAEVPGSNDSDIANAGAGSIAGFNGTADNRVSVTSTSGAGVSSDYVPTGDYSSWGSGSENYVSHDGYSAYGNGGYTGEDYSNSGGGALDYANYGSDYGSYASYGQYQSNWTDGSTASAVPQMSGSTENVLRMHGKRGRNGAPEEIVEVKQDELMKNRPREDQVKLTGIAFGPSYQPTSTKGKPTKLHKRKHQIGSLYFDMRQKEMELAERRAKGFLTKAQTQGKYGW